MVTQPVTMYDSLDVTAIPAGATFVAGYIDGRDAWPADQWLRLRPGP